MVNILNQLLKDFSYQWKNINISESKSNYIKITALKINFRIKRNINSETTPDKIGEINHDDTIILNFD